MSDTRNPSSSASSIQSVPVPSPNGLAPHTARIQFGIGLLAAVALAALAYWFFFMRGIVFTDDARLAGHLVDVAPAIDGRLVDVAVREGQFVKSGAIVFRLNPATAEAALNEAEAALASARAGVTASEAKCERVVNGSRPEEIRAGEAVVKRLQNEADLATVEARRMNELWQRGSVAQDAVDHAHTAHESALQSLASAAEALAVLRQGSRKEDIDAARAEVELARGKAAEAEAAMKKAQSLLDLCCVKAPFDGWVVRRWLDPGDMPLPGQPVASLFDPTTTRVDANIEEKDLHAVAIGDEVDIAVDAYPHLRLKGRVTDILRAVNSQFSLIPAEGVSGSFIKVTQRVPLRIAVTVPPDLPLGPGLSVEVRIHIGTLQPPRSPERARP